MHLPCVYKWLLDWTEEFSANPLDPFAPHGIFSLPLDSAWSIFSIALLLSFEASLLFCLEFLVFTIEQLLNLAKLDTFFLVYY